MGRIAIDFNDQNQARFTIKTDSDEQIFTALLGIEAYMADKVGLHIDDIRSIIDDMKKDTVLRATEEVDDAIDMEDK